MSKKVLAFISVLIIGGVILIGWPRLFQKSEKKTQTYHYEISSSGGMGAQLQIESNWQGSVTVSPGDEDHQRLFRAFSTQAKILVNGAERKDLVDSPLKDYEKTVWVELDPALGIMTLLNYESELKDATHVSILENQLKGLAHLLFIPSINVKETKFKAPCFMGQCEYRIEKKADQKSYTLIRKTVSGMAIEARLKVQYDEDGIVEIRGFEETPGADASGASTHTTYLLKRIESGETLELAARPSRSMGPSIAEMSTQQKRSILTQQLEGISLKSILNEARNLAPGANEWGNVYVHLKDMLWLHPELIAELSEILKQMNPNERLFISSINALASLGTEEAQMALKEIAITFRKDKKAGPSLLISLAGTKTPNAGTQDYIKSLSRWDSPSATSEALLARRLSGMVARSMGDTPEAGELVSPALARLENANQGNKVADEELVEVIDALGNSGHSSIENQVNAVLSREASPLVRKTAIMALRFVPGARVTERLWETAKTSAEDDAKSARVSLELRCNIMPSECPEEVHGWLKVAQ